METETEEEARKEEKRGRKRNRTQHRVKKSLCRADCRKTRKDWHTIHSCRMKPNLWAGPLQVREEKHQETRCNEKCANKKVPAGNTEL